MTMSELKPLQVLVTGANGFLGSEIVRQVVAENMPVRATDRHEDSLFPNVEYCQADILEPESLLPSLKDVDAVIHAAGLAHIFGRSDAETAPFRAINEQGTANVAREASKAGVGHFILISSVSVYGDGTLGATEDSICRPQGPYAESKWEAEQRAIEVAQRGDMRLTIFRLATLYGEGDPGNVARLMRSIDRGRFVWIGDGSNKKSLLYRGDAARACLIVLQSENSASISIFNISAPPVAMSDVIEGLASALGRGVPRWRLPAPLAVNLSSIAASVTRRKGRFGTLELTLKKWLADDVYDARKFQRTFGFTAETELAEGLRREVEWYRRSRQK